MNIRHIKKAMLGVAALILAQQLVLAQTTVPSPNPPAPTPPAPAPPVPATPIPPPTKDIYPPSNDDAIGGCEVDPQHHSSPANCESGQTMGRGWRLPSVLKEAGWLICTQEGWTDVSVAGNCVDGISQPDRLTIWARCSAEPENKIGGMGGHAYYRLVRVHLVLQTDTTDLNENCTPTAKPTGRQPENGSIVFRGCSNGDHTGTPLCGKIGDPTDAIVPCPPNIGYCDNNPNPIGANPPDQSVN